MPRARVKKAPDTRLTNIRHQDALQNQKDALALRQAGYSYQQIADRLGYADNSGAYRAVKACMDLDRADGAQELRYTMNLQLDQLLVVWMAEAFAHLDEKGQRKQKANSKGEMVDIAPNGGAADRVMRIIHQKAELNGMLVNKIAPVSEDGQGNYVPYVPDQGSATAILNVLASIGVLPNVINGEFAERAAGPSAEGSYPPAE